MRNYGFVEVATAVFPVSPGNVNKNTKAIMDIIQETKTNTALMVFPELCITGYTCQDMFLHSDLISDAEEAIKIITTLSASANPDTIFVVGAPLRNSGKLYNCAIFINKGKIIAVVPKTYLPNYNEFYERRHFASADDSDDDTINICNMTDIPFGTDIIIDVAGDDFKIGCELCEDLWVPNPPSAMLARHGVHVVVNPSASNEIVSKKEYRRDLVRMQSARCNCAYVYSSAGYGESTTDVVYSGHQIIASCGSIYAEEMYDYGSEALITKAVIDIEKIENDQVKMNSMHGKTGVKYRTVSICRNYNSVAIPQKINPYPFIPSIKGKRMQRCSEIMRIQALGLVKRLDSTGIKKCVIGISGGLDSTLALLVIAEAYKILGYPTKDIIGITMPGFGTTEKTKDSAYRLMELIGTTTMAIDIRQACVQHMSDIKHDLNNYDVTYENVQARERTQILMDVANQEGALVIGTGDMSELALGWCTYNGDHMSMYAVNVSVPKTLVKFIIETYAENAKNAGNDDIYNVLIEICNTTISPELLPPDENGEIKQSTEQSIGKYDLHDFFLYHFIRNGFGTKKILEMACVAFENITRKQIEETMDIFINRFKHNQFKRNCIPDGPKVGSVALSPRGDWRMPSDYD